MKQLVISGNRILAYGEGECFLQMGEHVICLETASLYQNATVVNYEAELPEDIDLVGYEYHNGAFVPCAPYGTGTGNVAVFCDKDCKALKDSGIPLSRMGQVVEMEYVGTGTSSNQNSTSAMLSDNNWTHLTFPAEPVFLFICQKAEEITIQNGAVPMFRVSGERILIISGESGYEFVTKDSYAQIASVFVRKDGTKISYIGSTAAVQMNENGKTYKIIAVLRKGD